MLSLFAGLFAGAAHVLAGPDHWVAVAPLSMAQPKRAARIGLRWGLGHGLGILALGILGIGLRNTISVEQVSMAAEALVGIVLVFSGLWALHRSKALIIHRHPHDHDHTTEHDHMHLHVGETTHDNVSAHQGHTHAAFGIGFLHGVAGTGQLWGLLPTLALPTHAAIMYLAAFLVASIGTMVTFSHLVGRVSEHGSKTNLQRTFALTGWGSIVFGIYWTGAVIVAV